MADPAGNGASRTPEQRPPFTLSSVQNRIAGLRGVHSPYAGNPCKVCLVADGYAQCATRHTLDDIAVILNDLIERDAQQSPDPSGNAPSEATS